MRRIWSFAQDEEEIRDLRSVEEMFFGGTGTGGGGGEQIFGGFNWDEPTLEQTWEEIYFVGGGIISSFNEATFEEIWDATVLRRGK